MMEMFDIYILILLITLGCMELLAVFTLYKIAIFSMKRRKKRREYEDKSQPPDGCEYRRANTGSCCMLDKDDHLYKCADTCANGKCPLNYKNENDEGDVK